MPIRFLPTVAICAATSPFIWSGQPAHAATKSERWTPYRNAHLGLSIERPAGWAVQAQNTDIVVQSPDHASLLMVEAFAAKSGETAKTHLNKFVATHPALFPHAQLQRVEQETVPGDVVVGAVAYVNSRGQLGEARVMCSVTQQSGLIYVMEAPTNQFSAQRPTLLHILKSLRFGATENASYTAPRNTHLRFVPWTDPKEHAFTIDAPAGWSVDGGAIRMATTQVNKMVTVASPDKSMLLSIGDPFLPMLEVPNPVQMRMYGVQESVPFNPNGNYIVMFLHYMPATEFNPWYLDTFFKHNIANFAVTKTTEMPEIAKRQAEAAVKAAHGGAQFEVTVATTEFKGTDKQSGKPIVGVLASTVQEVKFPNGATYWGPTTLVISGCSNDGQLKMHQAVLRTVLEHVSRSWRDDPQWELKEQQMAAQGTERVNGQSQAAIDEIAKRSRQTAADADAARESLMSSYWNRVGVKDEQQRQQANYYGDQTDVGTLGASSKVGAGYSNYYFDARTHTIVGTNSPNHPSVDFAPLSQF